MKFKIPDNLTNEYIINLIDSYIRSERDRAILKRRLIDGIKYDDLAKEFNYDVRHIKRIVDKAEKELFKHIDF